MRSFRQILQEGEALRLECEAEAARQLVQAFADHRARMEFTGASKVADDWDHVLAPYGRKGKEDAAPDPDQRDDNRRQRQKPPPRRRRRRGHSSSLSDLGDADDWDSALSEFAPADHETNAGGDDAGQPAGTVERSWDQALNGVVDTSSGSAARPGRNLPSRLWHSIFGAD